MIEYTVFLHGLASNGGCERNEIWDKGSLRVRMMPELWIHA